MRGPLFSGPARLLLPVGVGVWLSLAAPLLDSGASGVPPVPSLGLGLSGAQFGGDDARPHRGGTGWIGLSYRSAPPHGPLLEPTPSGRVGIRVVEVVPGSPAAIAGLSHGDFLVAVAGLPVPLPPEDFEFRTRTLRPGDPLHVEVDREGRLLAFELLAIPRPSPQELVIAAASEVERAFARIAERAREDGLRMERQRSEIARSVEARNGHADSLRHAAGERITLTFRDLAHRALLRGEERERRALVLRGQPGEPPSPPGTAPGPEMLVTTFEIPDVSWPSFASPRLIGSRFIAGAELLPLAPPLSEYFGGELGLLITHVLPGSPAEEGGLRAGDVLLRIANRTVHTVEDARRATGEWIDRYRREEPIPVTAVRRGDTILLQLPE